MATYNNVKYLSLPQQVEKNRLDIETLANSIVDGAVGPQGATGPRGPQGVIGNTGLTGPAGANGTPVAGLSYTSDSDGTTQAINLTTANFSSRRFLAKYSLINDQRKYLRLEVNGSVIANLFISTVDSILLTHLSNGDYYLLCYDMDGNVVELNEGVATTSFRFLSQTNSTTNTFTLNEVLAGSTVGPAGAQGATGATGPQGATGPTGAQGIQGLPGLKNMAFLETYVNEATFTPYAYRVMIQIVGGDYDGYTAIKETLVNGSTIKFGPYATLVTIETNGGVIQSILQNGVTSIRVYKIDNIS